MLDGVSVVRRLRGDNTVTS